MLSFLHVSADTLQMLSGSMELVAPISDSTVTDYFHSRNLDWTSQVVAI